jgi:hypothetical protein
MPGKHRTGGAYNLFRIEGSDGGYVCTMTTRGIRVRGGMVETLSEVPLSMEPQPAGTLTQA